jgi:hypothetical protein
MSVVVMLAAEPVVEGIRDGGGVSGLAIDHRGQSRDGRAVPKNECDPLQ